MPFQIRSMGIYMVVDTTVGLILMWDKKTSIFIKLSPSFQVYFESENTNKMNSVTYSYLSQRQRVEIQAVNQETATKRAEVTSYPCYVDLNCLLCIILELDYSAMA